MYKKNNLKLHFAGIGGSGINGVAYLAERMGYNVSGCDLEESTAYGKNILKGHSSSHIKNVDLVVCSPALFFSAEENVEITAAKKQGKLITWQEFLGKTLLKDKKVICIAGTHGKSTTTAMAGKMLIDAGLDPIVMVGANVPEWNGNSRFGLGEYAVIEADEFNNNFLNYSPDIAIINNIEFDHPDFFRNEEEVYESFRKFIGNLKGEKILIIEKDSLNKKFNLKILGAHNQKNANMVFLLGKKLGLGDENIIKSIENFSGISRRLELITNRGGVNPDSIGVKVYDDYAHHPTAIKATLEAIRKEYPNAKILVIDEPHGYKRTKALLKNYKGVFDSADKVIIGPIYKARDAVDESITAQLVARTSDHKNAIGLNSFEEIIKNLELIIINYDVVVVMGAGKSYLWAKEIAKLIPMKFSDLTTFRIGGKIKRYFETKTKDEVVSAVKFAKKNKLPIFIIGGGTDILVADKRFEGVVIKYVGDNIFFNNEIATAEAGANWDKFTELVVEKGLQGIESLSGIPGTTGAAPIQNIGAYGQELKETFVSLLAYDIEKEKFITFNNNDCKFGYRESVFKQKSYWQKYIICSIKLKLTKNIYGKANYESLSKYITSENPTINEIREAVLKVRSEKLEDPKLVGNAGSFFKNPIIDSKEKTNLETKCSGIKIFPFGDEFKISAAWLIEQTGWKGKEYKNAAVSAKHALIITNPNGHATAKDVYDLSAQIITDVYKKFGVKLEREVQLINF